MGSALIPLAQALFLIFNFCCFLKVLSPQRLWPFPGLPGTPLPHLSCSLVPCFQATSSWTGGAVCILQAHHIPFLKDTPTPWASAGRMCCIQSLAPAFQMGLLLTTREWRNVGALCYSKAALLF